MALEATLPRPAATFSPADDRLPPKAVRLVGAAILDEVVGELISINRRTGLERAMAIGELILQRFFRGDPNGWRDRRRNKRSSIRRLAKRPDCPFSRSTLSEAVSVYLAVVELPSVRTLSHIGASHVASVLTLPVAERLQMLQRAEEERWGVRDLRREVTNVRRGRGERRGRPAVKTEERQLTVLETSVRQSMQAVGTLESLGSLCAESHPAACSAAQAFSTLGARLAALVSPRWKHA